MTDSLKIPSYIPGNKVALYKRVVAESVMPRTASTEWAGEVWMRNFANAPRDGNEYAAKLATIRRGIANFVYIMTKKNIPVTFSTGRQSYATRDQIVISATTDPAKMDANVGVALHEAGHIILTKRSDIKESIPLWDWLAFIKNHADLIIPANVFDEAARIGKSRSDVKQDLKIMLNVIEDRRIDTWVYTHAVGYRRYYDAMYADLWNKPLISRALVHPLGRRRIWDCYHLHIVNLTNPLHDADALPGLREIVNLINLADINRFSYDEKWDWWSDKRWIMVSGNPDDFKRDELPDMIQCAVKVLEIAYTNCMSPSDVKVQQYHGDTFEEGEEVEESPISDMTEEDIPEDKKSEKEQVAMNPKNAKPKDQKHLDKADMDVPDDEDEKDETDKDRGDSDDNDEELTDEEDEDSDATEEDEDEDGDESDEDEEDDIVGDALGENDGEDMKDAKAKPAESADDKAKRAEKELAAKLDNAKDSNDFDNAVKEINSEQDKALDGDAPKVAISADQGQAIEAAEESGAEIHTVGEGMDEKVTCIVFPRMTESLLMSPSYSFVKRGNKYPTLNEDSVKAVNDGERLGSILAHKLRVMADATTTQYPRQRHGKIDKRHIAGLGFGDENVFSHSVTEMHKPVKLHFSVDASGSMAGAKWRKSLTLAVALCKAAEKVKTVDVVISLRGTGEGEAQLAIIYDSSIDKFGKVRRFFPYFGPYGGTPEGLCFEAVLDRIIAADTGTRNFFVNISDGEPAMAFHTNGKFVMYSGEGAWKHTALQVRKIQEAGVTVLSYFVSGSAWQLGASGTAFKAMYGKAASFIDTENVTAIAATLNRLFLQ